MIRGREAGRPSCGQRRGQGDGAHLERTGLQQGVGGGFEGAARRQDVVDDPDTRIGH